MLDQYFTPKHIAANLLSSLPVKSIKSVADFAVGDGSLIKHLPFKASKFIGLDLDSNVISKLRESNPKWDLKNGDFLNPDESTERWLAALTNSLDLIVLNPPFSCKGKKRIIIKISENQTLICRTSLAFLIKALPYLNKTGVLTAILPLSCIKSEADNVVLTYLKKSWEITFGEKFGRGTFKDCTPNSVVITLKRKQKKTVSEEMNCLLDEYNLKAQVLRGSTPMFTTSEKGRYRVLHTSNLQKNSIAKQFRYSNNETKSVSGSYLCIPRVGRPSIEKIVLVQNQTFILSDCIIAIRGESLEQTHIIKKGILDNWDQFRLLYDSTCAPYITLNQLKIFLRILKVNSDVVLNFNNSSENCINLSHSIIPTSSSHSLAITNNDLLIY